MAWSLVKAMLGYDPTDLDRIEAEGTTGIQEEKYEIEDRWVPATLLLTLALWRTARTMDVLVDDVPLYQARPFLSGANGLIADPMPVLRPGMLRPPRSRYGKNGDLIERARRALLWNLATDTADRGGELLLGDRHREIAHGPYQAGRCSRFLASSGPIRRHRPTTSVSMLSSTARP
ncbi:hypothetical protein GCM10010207_75070 [Streptomyces atratus]|uniref:hypothetical protein n=1 Tax=Streptomyces atratus TaxID=1893 RepID=UPI001670E46F|nr:hypothetical protein [Streptomyces atratus]GGT64806.1 hypothetical protein GCM10010207_75070 [Streptomyces atratus]